MQTYTRGDLTFDVTDAGPQDGPVVVLLHGFPQDRQAWDKVVPHLVEAGCRVLAPDQRGYSPAAAPRGRTSYGLHELVADVVALLEAAGTDHAHIVGHDWGGAVAWQMAASHPELTASCTVLSTPHPDALFWAMTHSDQWRKSSYMAFFQLPWIAERAVLRQLPGMYLKTGMDIADAQKYANRFSTPSSLTGPLNWYRSMLTDQARGALKRRKSSGDGHHRITVPTTYVWGSRDFALGRAAAEKTAETVASDYEFVELDGAGHWLPEVNAGDVATALLRRIRSTQ